jgi:hypothetical protein
LEADRRGFQAGKSYILLFGGLFFMSYDPNQPNPYNPSAAQNPYDATEISANPYGGQNVPPAPQNPYGAPGTPPTPTPPSYNPTQLAPQPGTPNTYSPYGAPVAATQMASQPGATPVPPYPGGPAATPPTQYAPQDPYANANPYSSAPQYEVSPSYTQVPPVMQDVRPKNNKSLLIILGVIGAVILIIVGSVVSLILYGAHAYQSSNANYNATSTAYDQQANATSTAEITQENVTATAARQQEVNSFNPPTKQADYYYTAIEAQDYTYAYGFIAPNTKWTDGTTVTAANFTTQAEALDTKYGVVTNYTVVTTDTTAQTITVSVTRQNAAAYNVTLKFEAGDIQYVIYDFTCC